MHSSTLIRSLPSMIALSLSMKSVTQNDKFMVSMLTRRYLSLRSNRNNGADKIEKYLWLEVDQLFPCSSSVPPLCPYHFHLKTLCRSCVSLELRWSWLAGLCYGAKVSSGQLLRVKWDESWIPFECLLLWPVCALVLPLFPSTPSE